MVLHHKFWSFSLWTWGNRLLLSSMFLLDVVTGGRFGSDVVAGITVVIPLLLVTHALGNGISQVVASKLAFVLGQGAAPNVCGVMVLAFRAALIGGVSNGLLLLIFGPYLCYALAGTMRQGEFAQSYLWAMILYTFCYFFFVMVRESALAFSRADVSFYQMGAFFVCKGVILLAVAFVDMDISDKSMVFYIGLSSVIGVVLSSVLSVWLLSPGLLKYRSNSSDQHQGGDGVLTIVGQGVYAGIIPASYGAYYAVLVMMFLKLGSDIAAARSYTGEAFLVMSAWPWAVATWGRIGIGLSCGACDVNQIWGYIRKSILASFLGVYPPLIAFYVFCDVLIGSVADEQAVIEVSQGMALIALGGESLRLLSIILMNALIGMQEVKRFAIWGVAITWGVLLPILMVSDAIAQSYMWLTVFFYIEYLLRVVIGGVLLRKAMIA